MAHTLATTGSVSRIQRLNFLHTQVALRCYNILKIALFASKLRYARRVFSSCQIGFAEVRPSTKNPAPVRVFLSELGHPRGSSPKSCVKSLCSSFFLIRVLLCQASLAGPSVSVGIKNRFLPKPSVQLLSPPYDRISCLHQECPTVLFPVLMDIHQNCANQAFR